MFDDHEVENDFFGLGHPLVEKGLTAYLKYWGQRNPGRPLNFSKLFYSFSYGSLASFFVIEDRLHYDVTKKELLGRVQKSCLIDWLRSGAQKRFSYLIIVSLPILSLVHSS